MVGLGFVQANLDDVIVATIEHLLSLEELLEKLATVNLCTNVKKRTLLREILNA
jgi:hypothetical protein